MNTIRLLAAITLLSLNACSQAADNPRDVADKYWQALRNGDIETARGLVSTGSRQAFRTFTESAGNTAAIGEIELGAQSTRVPTIIYPAEQSPDDYRAFDTLLVMEDGEWKIDAEATVIPPVSGGEDRDAKAEKLKESMQENIDSMEESLSEGMQLLHEALREGSNEMGESLLKGMQELNRSLHESVEQLRQHREQKTPAPPQPPADGEGVI